jgi:hypothetical protein
MTNRIFFILSLFVLLSGSMLVAQSDSSISILSKDGAWCWFQDPRAVYIAGKHQKTYAGWVTHDGQLQVGAYNHVTNETEIVTIRENWGTDDHNTGLRAYLVLKIHY